MAFCGSCGAQIHEGQKFCSSCGRSFAATETPQPAQAQEQQSPQQQVQQQYQQQPDQQQQYQQQNPGQGVNKLLDLVQNTADETANIDPNDIAQNKTMGGLAYFIFFLPLIVCPQSKYGRFHANQGLLYAILCVCSAIVSFLLSTIFTWRLWWLSSILSWAIWLCVVALGIVGLVNGFSGKAKDLPLIGKIRLIN